MTPTAFLQLPKALYEWNKECPKDLVQDLESFFQSNDFLDRPDVFFQGMENSSKKWVALISVQGLGSTRTMIHTRFQHNFQELRAARETTFSQVTSAPRLAVAAAYRKFMKDLDKTNKANKAMKAKTKAEGWVKELIRATEMVLLAPGTAETKGDGASQPTSSTMAAASSVLTSRELSAATFGMWFISVDIESYERDHSRILEIGWSIWDSREHKIADKHYAISDYQHLKNGKYVPDRRDRFSFGQTVDEGYLRQMGIVFPETMIKFDTLNLNVGRTGNATKTGLGKLLDELEIENYSLHNAGNDAHYTMELFLCLTRNNAKQKDLDGAVVPS
ncbi:hypothetical protein BGZ65_000106 [Modicella reniformis]|uniref:Gfd2/YDR514C-like C-terminal domain-containing protein n=1 Tax=Modicella reniformis TaxID=1440133 RepID=A0A9P6SUL5_9FUNG|nr:hypothetical protein BGZ65_000106 [Modicella reniformis]